MDRRDELLAYLLKGEGIERHSEYTIPVRDNDGSPPPLSFAQERFWFLDQFEQAHPIYNGCKVVRLIGRLQTEVLVECLNLIVRRHEVLRTTYPAPGGRPTARVALACSVDISITDLGHVSESELPHAIERLARHEWLQPINLSQDLPIRARLVRIDRADNLLFLTLHQIASDSQSVAIFFHELWSSYEAKLNGREPELPPLPVQYGDFASWQRRRVADQIFQSQCEYWMQRLSGTLPVLNLPTDKPRPPVQGFDGSRLSVHLPKTLQLKLKALSRENNVTLFMTLLAAFKTLLYRYTAEEDLLVASPVLNRGLPEIENLLGSFVNTLVLRTSYAGNLTFREALQRVRETCVGAFTHQDFPFEKLVEELQPERDLARNPIFQVMFTFQNTLVPSLELADLRSEAVEIDGGMTKFDLTFSVVDKEHGIAGHIEYSTDLFHRDTIEGMGRHFQTLLEEIVADPDQSIATLPIMTESERHQILFQWNDTTADYPKDKCVHELFEAQVERTPDAVAVKYEGQQLTYQDLNRCSNQLAHYLMRSGVGPEKLVGIYAERSIKMVIGLLAILKAGGAYVPLEPTYPKERVMFMIKEAQLALVLTEERLKFELEGYDGQVICVDSDWNEIAKQSVKNVTPVEKPDNLAYVMFTSGSTGYPKGVMITHRGISNRLLWMQDAYHLTESDRVLHKTPISFDVSVWEIFWPLLNGASLVVARPSGHQDHVYLAELIVQKKITVLHFVPSMLQVFLEQLRLDGCGDLRLVICSGEALSVDLQERFFARLGAELHNLYGPTEASIDVTSWACERRSNRSSVPIGKPIANTQIYILDSHMEPVPIGIPGDLYIGGESLARGYLNRPDLTAEKFVVNPIGDRSRSRLYRTGDRARYLIDGNIEFLGRIDNQVKIRGYRIELSEIEFVLNQHPAVRTCLVVGRAHNLFPEQSLIGYVVPKQHPAPSVAELRRYLKEQLPEYMIPSVFMLLDDLPLTLNGKIDRNALPPPDGERPQLDQGFGEPRTEIEELIAQVWREVLKLDRIGVYDNFFDLGGHSLLATRVVARLRRDFNVDLALRKLFELPTVAGLAQHIDYSRRSGSGMVNAPIMPAPRDQRNLPSIGQETLLFLDELIPNTHLFNISAVYRLRGPLDLEMFAQSLDCLIMRQEALRTTFPIVDGQRMLLVGDHLEADLNVVDLQSLSETEFESRAENVVREEVMRPFDLATGPLFRTSLLRHSNEHHVFVVTVHHVISDAWSMVQFFKELGLHYECLLNGRPSVKELSIQFADFACWQRQAVDDGIMQSQLAYWQGELEGSLAPLTFIGSRGPLKELSFRTGRKAVSITGRTLEALNRLSHAQGCTTFMTLLAAFKVLLYSYTSQDDIRVATLVANRSRDEVQDLIGHFLNTIVLRTQIAADRTFAQLQAGVRETTLAALNNDELPFETLVRNIESTRNLDRAAVAQVMLVHQSSPVCPIQLPGIAAEVIDYGLREQDNVTITSFDLILFLKERGSQLVGSLIYKSDLFGEEFVDQMLNRFYIILERACANPHVVVGDLLDSLRAGADRPLT